MKTVPNSLLLLLIFCINMSAVAMNADSANSDKLQIQSGNSVTTLKANAFLPNFSITPRLHSELTDDAQYKNDVLQAIVNSEISQETITTIDPVNKLAANHSKQPVLDLSKLESIIKSAVLTVETEKLQNTLAQEKQEIITTAKQEEAATLSLLQRHPKKSIAIALAAGFTLPFIIPDLLKKAGL